MRHDGTIPRKETYLTPDKIDLSELSRRYLETHGNGALESNSLLTTKIHLKHWQTTLGPKFPILELKTADLQSHIDRRLKKRGVQGQPLSTATIRKEIAGLRAVWNWAGHMGLVAGDFPNRGLVFPKTEEKPPFMTYAEIERRIATGGVSKPAEAQL